MKNSFLAAVCLSLSWMLTTCGLQAAPADPLQMTPEEVVEGFYNWYLEYPGSPAADGELANSPYLTTAYIQEVDRTIASFRRQGGGADPILWSLDYPQAFTVEGFIQEENSAQVVVHQTFGPSNNQDLSVDLIKEDGEWKISGIRRGSPLTPDGVVQLFYQWYLTRSRQEAGPPDIHSLRENPYITIEFLDSVEVQAGALEDSGLDPFTLLKAVPEEINVYAPVIVENRASVLVEFSWVLPGGPRQVKLRRILLEQNDGRWQVDGISERIFDKIAPDPAIQFPYARWQVYDSTYGFSIRYPVGWVTHTDDISEPPTVFFMPSLVAGEVLQKEGGSILDRTRPTPIPPFSLRVVVGKMDESPVSGSIEKKLFNGYPAEIERLDDGRVRYVFDHPHRKDTWVIIEDWVAAHPLYEEQAQAVKGLPERMLNSIEFHAGS